MNSRKFIEEVISQNEEQKVICSLDIFLALCSQEK